MAAQAERESKKSPFSDNCALSHILHKRSSLFHPCACFYFEEKKRGTCRLDRTFGRFDFCGGDEAGQVVGHEGQRFLAPIRPSSLFPSLYR